MTLATMSWVESEAFSGRSITVKICSAMPSSLNHASGFNDQYLGRLMAIGGEGPPSSPTGLGGNASLILPRFVPHLLFSFAYNDWRRNPRRFSFTKNLAEICLGLRRPHFIVTLPLRLPPPFASPPRSLVAPTKMDGVIHSISKRDRKSVV